LYNITDQRRRNSYTIIDRCAAEPYRKQEGHELYNIIDKRKTNFI